jgi:mono/diheme cytochrome c family protein
LSRFGAGLLALTAVLVVSGCGQTGLAKQGDVSQGKQLFVSKCGGCHRLADAATQGTQGPDLDGAFAGARQQKFKISTIRQVVYDQIYHAAAPMPRKLVTGDDASAVASYVASVAGSGTASEGAPPTLTTTTATTSTGGGRGGSTAATGAKLFESLGCSGCHSLTGAKQTGPPLNGLFGTKVQLASGGPVTADENYLLESILDPDKRIVKGYPKGIMSATIRPGSVPKNQAEALVAFIKSKR